MKIPLFMLNQDCLVKPYLGTSPTGIKYGTEFNIRCRPGLKKVKVVTSAGKEIVANGTIYLVATELSMQIKPDTKLTVQGSTYNVVQVGVHWGFEVSHVECVVI